MLMKRKYVKVIIIASCCLLLIVGFGMIRKLIDHKQVEKQVEESTIKETTPPKQQFRIGQKNTIEECERNQLRWW